MIAPYCTDDPCGRPRIAPVTPEVRKALDRQREIDTGTERFRLFLAQYRSLTRQMNYLADEIEAAMEQGGR